MDIGYFLKLMIEKNVLDMFLIIGVLVYIKIEGKLYLLGNIGLLFGMVKKIVYLLMDEGQVLQFECELEFNMVIVLLDVGCFCVNVFKQCGEVGMVICVICSKIFSIEEFNFLQVFKDVIMILCGLVLVVGLIGLGKLILLVLMIDYCNSIMIGYIFIIEDLIEYLYKYKMFIVNQCEVGLDIYVFYNVLKNVMCEVLDVILIGEILDVEMMEVVIVFVEIGYLCLVILYFNNVDQIIECIFNFFLESVYCNVLMNFFFNLCVVVFQWLVKGKDGCCLLVIEVLINILMICDLLCCGQVYEIKVVMEVLLEEGMESFDQCLFWMVKLGIIEQEEVLCVVDLCDGLVLKFCLFEGGSGEYDFYVDYLVVILVVIMYGF